jgi:ankyrin repeat protein
MMGAPEGLEELNKRLVEAVAGDDLDTARECLAAGASANHAVVSETPGFNHESTSVLYTACQNRNTAMVELLLADGADPNNGYWEASIIDSKSTPCLIAALSSIEIVRRLLEKGADPNATRRSREDRLSEESALWIAQEGLRDIPELAQLLIEYGARAIKS